MSSGSAPNHRHCHAICVVKLLINIAFLNYLIIYLFFFKKEKIKYHQNKIAWHTHQQKKLQEMIDVSSVGLEDLLVSLLRRIGSGDYGEQNVWLCCALQKLT